MTEDRERKGNTPPTTPIIVLIHSVLWFISICGLDNILYFRMLSENLQDTYAIELFLSQTGEGGICQLAYPGGG